MRKPKMTMPDGPVRGEKVVTKMPMSKMGMAKGIAKAVLMGGMVGAAAKTGMAAAKKIRKMRRGY